jgi:chromosome segregation ATPase
MSSNLESIVSDLDRTDELPRLDVAEYEAALAKNAETLARTDVWSVSALQDMDDLAESQDGASVAAASKNAEPAAFTVNVDGILKRIADLERDVVAAHEANEALTKGTETIQADRERLASRIQTLEAENARQREHRALAQEIAERTERKLADELQRAKDEIQALQSAGAAERTKAEAERTELRRQLGEGATQRNALLDEKGALENHLSAATEESRQTAALLAATQDLLEHQRSLVAQLSRQLAAKLTDYDKISALLDVRNGMIEALIETRDSLDERLRQELAAAVDRSSALAGAREDLEQHRAMLVERDNSIAQKDREITEASAEICALRASLAAAEQRTIEVQGELAISNDAVAEVEERYATLRSELEQTRVELANVEMEMQAARAAIRDLTQERDALSDLPGQMAERAAELEQTALELAQLRAQLHSERSTAEARIRELAGQRDALLPLELTLAERDAALELSNREIGRIGVELAAAQAALQENGRASEERSAEIESMRTKLREHAKTVRGLEHAIATRDELAEQLRAQLQTAQEERAIVSNQLEKARRRVKGLTEDVFRRDHRIGELRTELTVHTEALAAIRRDVNRIGHEGEEASDEIERVLEPVDHDGDAIALIGKMLTVGRTNESDVCIPSKLVSRHHARLLLSPNGVIIEDAGSTNGCYVNGKQVGKHLMQDGDLLELGDLRYRLQTRSPQDTKIRTNVIPILQPRPNA